ncbi:MAG: hypothetical protein ACK4IX_17190 [Candidatus Sericytochromatia bacterium]
MSEIRYITIQGNRVKLEQLKFGAGLIYNNQTKEISVNQATTPEDVKNIKRAFVLSFLQI